jgi:superfamily II DNA/RNA helicase
LNGIGVALVHGHEHATHLMPIVEHVLSYARHNSVTLLQFTPAILARTILLVAQVQETVDKKMHHVIERVRVVPIFGQ